MSQEECLEFLDTLRDENGDLPPDVQAELKKQFTRNLIKESGERKQNFVIIFHSALHASSDHKQARL